MNTGSVILFALAVAQTLNSDFSAEYLNGHIGSPLFRFLVHPPRNRQNFPGKQQSEAYFNAFTTAFRYDPIDPNASLVRNRPLTRIDAAKRAGFQAGRSGRFENLNAKERALIDTKYGPICRLRQFNIPRNLAKFAPCLISDKASFDRYFGEFMATDHSGSLARKAFNNLAKTCSWGKQSVLFVHGRRESGSIRHSVELRLSPPGPLVCRHLRFSPTLHTADLVYSTIAVIIPHSLSDTVNLKSEHFDQLTFSIPN